MQLYSRPHLATGDGQRVVVLMDCPARGCGGTEVWGSADGGPWTRRYSSPDILSARVGFTGPGFVAVGQAEDQARYVVLGSADGATWSEIPHDSTIDPADGDECSPAWLVGANGTVLLGGESQCINWRGAVTVP